MIQLIINQLMIQSIVNQFISRTQLISEINTFSLFNKIKLDITNLSYVNQSDKFKILITNQSVIINLVIKNKFIANQFNIKILFTISLILDQRVKHPTIKKSL